MEQAIETQPWWLRFASLPLGAAVGAAAGSLGFAAMNWPLVLIGEYGPDAMAMAWIAGAIGGAPLGVIAWTWRPAPWRAALAMGVVAALAAGGWYVAQYVLDRANLLARPDYWHQVRFLVGAGVEAVVISAGAGAAAGLAAAYGGRKLRLPTLTPVPHMVAKYKALAGDRPRIRL